MSRKKPEKQPFLEICLIINCLGLCYLLSRVGPYRTVALDLFYLPVVLAAFFLGRYRAGILALFCVICAAVVTALDLNTLAASSSPLAVGLALTIWGAVVGITALLVGTLSDEIIRTVRDYVTLLYRDPSMNPREVFDALENGLEGDYHPAVIHAIEQVVLRATEHQPTSTSSLSWQARGHRESRTRPSPPCRRSR